MQRTIACTFSHGIISLFSFSLNYLSSFLFRIVPFLSYQDIFGENKNGRTLLVVAKQPCSIARPSCDYLSHRHHPLVPIPFKSRSVIKCPFPISKIHNSILNQIQFQTIVCSFKLIFPFPICFYFQEQRSYSLSFIILFPVKLTT